MRAESRLFQRQNQKRNLRNPISLCALASKFFSLSRPAVFDQEILPFTTQAFLSLMAARRLFSTKKKKKKKKKKNDEKNDEKNLDTKLQASTVRIPLLGGFSAPN